ncbi:MAG TPA: hypothetical protein VG894_04340 [Bauldia sp.]|nr:hypothetical protein [Bauldia sp.]
MTKRRKAPKTRKGTRNPVAQAVRTPRFRPRVEPKANAYHRRPKHAADSGTDEPDEK